MTYTPRVKYVNRVLTNHYVFVCDAGSYGSEINCGNEYEKEEDGYTFKFSDKNGHHTLHFCSAACATLWMVANFMDLSSFEIWKKKCDFCISPRGINDQTQK